MYMSVKKKCFQFVFERVQWDVCGLQIVWRAVSYSWSTDREAAITITCLCGMTSWRLLAVCSCWRPVSDVIVQCCVRLSGTRLWRHLYIITTVLKVIHCRTGNQWRLRRTGVIRSYLVAPVTRRAAAFWIICKLYSNWPLTPTNALLQ